MNNIIRNPRPRTEGQFDDGYEESHKGHKKAESDRGSEESIVPLHKGILKTTEVQVS
jgi:hypothetical protein